MAATSAPSTRARPPPIAAGEVMGPCSTSRRTCSSAASRQKPKAEFRNRVPDESLHTEDRVPPIDRLLAIRGVLREDAVKRIKHNMRAALRSAKPTIPAEEFKILERAIEDFLAL